jgi:DNA-binding GntR family transcriptional regulator
MLVSDPFELPDPNMDILHIPNLAREISLHIRTTGMEPGTRLPERKLAEHFRVSRTPVTRALRLLADMKIVAASASGGYVVGSEAQSLPVESLDEATLSDDENLYLQLADDHANNRLSGRMTENELMRRYSVSRGILTRVLRRASLEGWAERLPGHGWALVPLLTPELTYEQSSRYRIIIEPAAILEPTFMLDRAALEACRAQQIAVFENVNHTPSPAEVFEIGSRFHEVVLRCSKNQFLINGLAQVNRLRRLTEYTRTFASSNWRARCREHAHIAELLLQGDRVAASEALRRHLTDSARDKCVEV